MKSPVIFRIFKNDQIHVVKQFVDKEQIVFGHSTDVDVELDSSEVSAIHCLVERRGNQYYLCDLGSAQGTYKKGQVILDEALSPGDEFNIGPFRVVFFMGATKATQPTASSEIVITPKPSSDSIVETKSTDEVGDDTEPAIAVTGQPPKGLEKKPTSAVANDSVVKTPSDVPKAPPSVVKPDIKKAPVVPRPTANIKSSIVATGVIGRKKSRGEKTFAPEDQIELREYIKPGKGQLVEVMVCWKERVLNTYHFAPAGMKTVGANKDIQTPEGSAPKDWTLLDCTSGHVVIRISSEMKIESSKIGEISTVVDSNYRLSQDEVVFISLINGMKLVIRYAPVAPAIPWESSLILSSSELTGILAALIVAALTSLIVSVMNPKKAPQEEEIQRVAQVIFEKPPVEIKKPEVKPPPPPPEPPKVQQPPPQPKPPEPQKVKVADKAQEQKTKGDPNLPQQKAQQAQSAGRASEVKPKDSKNTTKMFTSTKQGGAIKTGNTAGANAQSKEPDPTNSGLLAAFGSGGARSKLDKAYSGSGELLGQGEKATGSSGFNEDRAGDDLGSKFKDTGAGGKGTATQGIAGVGTKGRGTGMSAYGSGTGFGSKDSVAIQAGGAEEEFVGSIDREAVRRVVRSALTQFKSCYDREYRKDTRLEGKVVIVWEIHAGGMARNASVDRGKSTIRNSSVEECVRSRLMSLRFPEPPPGTIAEVTYPFLFQGQK